MERTIYRIIDANFNRAREALRTIEEFCRFTLDSAPLTGRTKQLRHQLSSAVAKLDAGRLLAARDTQKDVGIGQKTEQQLLRSDLKDCLTAACKKLPEALRVLAETTQPLNTSVSEKLENLRYAAYTLEKDVTIFSNTTEKFKTVKLYIVITGNLPTEIISLTTSCAAGGADCIQMRAKNMPDDELLALASEFTRLCRQTGVLSIINDRIDIAVAANADGVHLGQHDLAVAQVRYLELSPLIVGKSTHSIEQLKDTCQHQPSYVSLGPVFKTPTKPALEPVGLDYVKQAQQVLTGTGIQSVAIGGVTADNVRQVLNAGAERIAVCSAVTRTANPEKACRLLKEKISG